MKCYKKSAHSYEYNDARCCFKTSNPAWTGAAAVLQNEWALEGRPITIHARGVIRTEASAYPFSFYFKHPSTQPHDLACGILMTMWRVYAVTWAVLDWNFDFCVTRERMKVVYMREEGNIGSTPHGSIRLSIEKPRAVWRFPLLSTLDWLRCSSWQLEIDRLAHNTPCEDCITDAVPKNSTRKCVPVDWLRANMAEVERVRGHILARGLVHLEVVDSDRGPAILLDLQTPKFNVGKLPAMIDPPHIAVFFVSVAALDKEVSWLRRSDAYLWPRCLSHAHVGEASMEGARL